MPVQSYEIAHPEYLYIQKGGETLYGCDQDWYQIEFRERAGCGPVAATNLLLYLKQKNGLEKPPYRNDSVDEALTAMNDVFLFVRPKRRGLHTVRRFVKGMGLLARNYGLSFRYQYLNVPPHEEKRPDLRTVTQFIADGLRNDVPVAFLNLHQGDVPELAGWHWVTIVGLQTREDGAQDTGDSGGDVVGAGDAGDAGVERPSDDTGDGAGDVGTGGAGTGGGAVDGAGRSPLAATIRFFDQAKALEMDLGVWLRTTQKGGGFAYFCKPTVRRE